jgi:hypothetical protein
VGRATAAGPKAEGDIRKLQEALDNLREPVFAAHEELIRLFGIGRILLPAAVLVSMQDFDNALAKLPHRMRDVMSVLTDKMKQVRADKTKNPDEIMSEINEAFVEMLSATLNVLQDYETQCEALVKKVEEAARTDLLTLSGTNESTERSAKTEVKS